MRTVWVVSIVTRDFPEGFKMCECTRPEIAGNLVTGLCMAYVGDDDPPMITIKTELRNAPMTVSTSTF